MKIKGMFGDKNIDINIKGLNLSAAAWVRLITVFAIIGFAYFMSQKDIDSIAGGNKPYIGVINIDKPITVEYMNDLMRDMALAEKNKKLKEFLVIINSPGGSPAASDEMAEFLKVLNKKKKVTLYVESVAASGSYYIASAIKPIIVNKNAIIGSIGVYLPHYSIKKLADKIGVEEDFIEKGEFKRPVSWFQTVTEKNKKYLQEHLLTPTYNNFISVVAKNRGVSEDKIRKFAEGQIFVGNDPKIQGILVDEVSNLVHIIENYKKKYNNNIWFKDLEFKASSFLPELKTKVKVDIGMGGMQ